MEKHGQEHKPKYFDEWKNPEDPDNIYYIYNGLYFEKDRKERNWQRLPDLYSEQLPPEIEEFEKATKKQKWLKSLYNTLKLILMYKLIINSFVLALSPLNR